MSKINRSGYGHRITFVHAGFYRLHWTFDVKYPSSRLRFPRTVTRDSTKAGAERFAKKWGCAMPPEANT